MLFFFLSFSLLFSSSVLLQNENQSIFIPYASVFFFFFFFFFFFLVLFWLVFFSLLVDFSLALIENRSPMINAVLIRSLSFFASLCVSISIEKEREREKVLLASTRHCSDRFSIGNHSVIEAVNVSRHSFFLFSSLLFSSLLSLCFPPVDRIRLSRLRPVAGEKKEMRREQEKKRRCDSEHTHAERKERKERKKERNVSHSFFFLFHHRVNLAAIIIVLITELREKAFTK